MSSSTSSTDWLVAGRVGRPHGLDGSFHVQEPRADLLARGATVIVAGDEREIVRRAGTDTRPIVAVAGCTDRTAAEALRGVELLVARATAPALGEDEFYAAELEGCRVHDAGVEVGVVRRMLALPSCEVLEVARAGGGADLLVPLIRDAIRQVDIEQRRIEIDLAFLGER
ncbi:MAG: rRNA processing protein RimM [Solirubrobacteraceae bacterium]|nr:rRNA processing protein RimM [Solirubrobacteraceae bacterium]